MEVCNLNEHSEKFPTVSEHYKNHLWNEQMVKNAVGRWITADEYTEITGKPLE